MRAYLDGTELEGEWATLGEVLESARARAGETGRMVVEAIGDGRPIDADALERPSSVVEGWTVVEFVSADPREMVASALSEAAGLLAGAREDHGAVVSALDAAEIGSARERLERVLGVWGTCVATLRDGAALVGLDLGAAREGARTPEALIAELLASLGEVKRCLGAEDWATLSDVVGEDLERQAGAWDAMLGGLVEEVGGAGKA